MEKVFLDSVSIPLSDVPRELLHVVQGNYTIILLWYCSLLGMGRIDSQNHRFSFLSLFQLKYIFLLILISSHWVTLHHTTN